jgi:hypothetical protein
MGLLLLLPPAALGEPAATRSLKELAPGLCGLRAEEGHEHHK